MLKITALLSTTALLISLAACGTTPTPLAPTPQDAVQDKAAPETAQTKQLGALSVRPSPVNYRVRYVIDTVQSTDTEDVSGADEFYALGTVAVRKPDGTKVARPFLFAPPIDVNDHAGEIHQLDYVMFDEVVPANADVFGQLVAYDEDTSKNWDAVRPLMMAKTNATAVTSTGLGDQVFVTTVVAAATGLMNLFMSGDKDDMLGNMGMMGVTANTSSTQTATLHMFKYGSWYSNWNYSIKYHVEITPTSNKVTL